MGMARTLEGFAHLAHAEGQTEKAVHHFAAAAALRTQIGTPLNAGDREETERALAELRADLGEAAFVRSWTMGQIMDIEKAVKYAVE